jgi:hypothetical protein
MNRKPIFDAVRSILGRGFQQFEVDALDLACDLAEASLNPVVPPPSKPARPATSSVKATAHVLGSLSEEYESSGRGPGVVSGGENDPGGVSYGVYQLSSKTGTCAAFVKSEGKLWSADFADLKPGSAQFSSVWTAIAVRDPDGFRAAQHAFIERTHYRRVVASVADRKGLDLNTLGSAVRDVVWSCAVQHGAAPNILIDAIDLVDRDIERTDPAYERKLIQAIYTARIGYVLLVSQNPKLTAGERNQLISITKNRYPKELADALKLLDGAAAPEVIQGQSPAGPFVNGNAIAASNGVDVKSSAVKIGKLHPSMEAVIVAVSQAAKALNLPKPVITSGNDGKHMNGSLHAKNRAIDFRGNNIKPSVGSKFRDDVAARLGKDYDVIFEVFMDPSNNHLHVEYDPK